MLSIGATEPAILWNHECVIHLSASVSSLHVYDISFTTALILEHDWIMSHNHGEKLSCPSPSLSILIIARWKAAST